MVVCEGGVVETSERSLKDNKNGMGEVTMKVKMTIFAKASEGFNFSKIIIFQFIFISF